MPRNRKALFFVLAGAILSIGSGSTRAQIRSNAPLPLITLTQAVQVLNLGPEQAGLKHPIRIRGVITCYDVRAQLCFVQDATAGVYVYQTDAALKLKPGDLVEVTGAAGPGLFSPIVHADRLARIGEAPLPAPKGISIEQLGSGREDSQWVEVEGIIRRENKDWGHLVMHLASGRSRLTMRVLDIPPDLTSNFTDAKVRVQGVAGSHFNDRRQLTGFHLLVPSLQQIQVLEAPAADPFNLPVRANRSLLSYSRQGGSEHRVRVRGVVTLPWPGKGIFISDESGGIQIQPLETIPVKAGDVIDVVGFAVASDYSPVLEDSIFRIVGKQELPEPVSITVTQALSGKFDNELVQMEAFLTSSDEIRADHSTLVLQADQKVFEVNVRKGGDAGIGGALQNGSKLKVTGICSVEVGKSATPKNFSLWLRSSEDIVVLQRPPWWTMVRPVWVLGSSAALAALALLWRALTRIRVHEQTKIIRHREAALALRCRDLFENAHDIIFTHDLAGQITSLNKAGEKAFGYTRDEALRMNIAELVIPQQRDLVRRQLEANLAGVPDDPQEIEVQAKSGERLIVEVSTRLTYEGNELTGLQGIARDITARKQTEAALRQSEQQLRSSMEERERIGRDLHDHIIQSIYAVGLNLEDCRRSVTQSPSEVERRLAKVLSDLNSVIREVRNFILGLESGLVKGHEFESALQSLVLALGERQAPRFGLEIDAKAAESLNPKQATHLVHVAREAMSNGVRHAAAGRIVISLNTSGEHLRFQVADDGVGFDTNGSECRGFGLRNMAARAQELGAAFSVNSQVGNGTRIVLDIPVEIHHQSARNETDPFAHR